jgi:arabinogalactan endo-1,4-beta-galactosidase
MKIRLNLLMFGVGLAVVACSSKSNTVAGGTGGSASGSGGAPAARTGGTSGGTQTGTGGAASTGGAIGSGGTTTPGTGGTLGTGGANATGGAAGSTTPIDAGVPDAPSADAPPPPPFTASYHIGADITWVQHDEFYGATYVDTDGVAKDILVLLKNHGFNSIRLRTFVDPRAADGYDKVDGFGDLAHTVTMGQRIKQAGMGFYLAVHYSDNWADPGKQCVPVAWQGLTTIAALATAVHDYTFTLVNSLKTAGAMPELVQVGNEITSGMLIHICDANGTPTATPALVNGRTSNWANLGTLLKAGIAAVKEVDPSIKTVLHIDRAGDANASVAFINAARTQTVPFEVFADSTYVYWHGQPSGWQNTYNMLVTTFPTLSFIIPEYGNETATTPPLTSTMRFVNDLIFNIPNSRGLGTWFYEPEHPFQAGPSAGISLGIGLFDGVHGDGGVVTGDSWPVFPALPAAMAAYDQMRTAYAGRL